MDPQENFSFFRYEACEQCGDCLSKCPYMRLDRETAVAEIQRMISGTPTQMVHDHCISCYACNAFCSRDCHPYELIISTWHDRYRRKGLPVRASYLMPASVPNFRTDMVKTMRPWEKALLEKWERTPPEGEFVVFPGCNALTLPHLLTGPLMEGLVISGDFDLCCGEIVFSAWGFLTWWRGWLKSSRPITGDGISAPCSLSARPG